MISTRTKRASVALIVRVRPHNDPIAMQPSKILPRKVKASKKPPKGGATQANASPHQSEARTQSTQSQPIPSPGVSSESQPQLPPPSPQPKFTPGFDPEAWLAQSWVRNGDLELLYMRRAANPNDRWSGQVAFPGGRQAKGESDFDTAVRETKEEVGLDLKDENSFQFICRLNDLQIDPFKNTKPLNVCSFVFLQITPVTPPFALEPSEVSSVVWCPFAFFGAYLPPGWTPSPSTTIKSLPTRFFRALGGTPQGMPPGALPSGRWLGSPLPWQELNYLSYFKNQNKVANTPLVPTSSDNTSTERRSYGTSGALTQTTTVTVLTTNFGVKNDAAPVSTSQQPQAQPQHPQQPETDEQLTEEENAEIEAVFKKRGESSPSDQGPGVAKSPANDPSTTKSDNQTTAAASTTATTPTASPPSRSAKKHQSSSSPWLPIRLTFPALHLPGVGIDSEGTVFSSQGSPQFLLWGFTLRTTGQLFRLLDVPYVDEHVKHGNQQRRRNLNLYHRYVEARGAISERVQRAKDLVASALQSTTSTLQKVLPEDQHKSSERGSGRSKQALAKLPPQTGGNQGSSRSEKSSGDVHNIHISSGVPAGSTSGSGSLATSSDNSPPTVSVPVQAPAYAELPSHLSPDHGIIVHGRYNADAPLRIVRYTSQL